jgi:hypothetical protein
MTSPKGIEPEDLLPFFQHFKGEPQQIEGVRELMAAMPQTLLLPSAKWKQTFRRKPEQKPPQSNPLKVPYFSQRDSGTEHALRMCFSSSCAMLLETLRPGTLSGANGDDRYLGRVLRYGDTTEAAAQLKALSSFGVEAQFVRNAGWGTVKAQIDKGIPVPLGILHKGPVSAPQGGGHWICAIGYADDALTVHDPFGEIDLLSGAYINNWGARLRYSKKNLGPRWMVEGQGSGWAILATT